MTTYHDNEYLMLVRHALEHGVLKPNRTGVDTISVFGHQMRFDLRDRTIPLLTTKKMFTRGIIHEILWYFQGADNIKYLTDNNVHTWDEWADTDGNLGPVYGKMWRKWPTYTVVGEEPGGLLHVCPDHIDQIATLINALKNNPNDRRMLVTAWNPAVLPDTKISFAENVRNGKQALPPCHYSFQCFARPLSALERVYEAGRKFHPSEIVENTTVATVESWLDEVNIPKYELSMLLNQRSCDIGLGVPFNIVQYSMMLRMLAHVSNMSPGEFIWNGGDVHIYEDHIEKLREQLTRKPLPSPTFEFARSIDSIDDFKFEDFVISGYTAHPSIKMDVAV